MDLLPSRRKAEVSAPVAESSEARQKFANAKAISSDMFFGRESSADYDTKTRLESMSGNSAISSADLFGENSDRSAESCSPSSYLDDVVMVEATDDFNFPEGVLDALGVAVNYTGQW
ncbi:ADP-ribosylation factor GTPase-activating protein 2-like [Gadus chalcogrammus]|uniref:ADP-ribosylation factor GTPase-activating protein 2-like n=1 Tax=Gadus chalcogrammus TaxID=1042646 RepID=UPI0024C4CC1D|nr:ADP-ribosylation factor GTPase-activating protein 2-like [Gadus chalcogrammus]